MSTEVVPELTPPGGATSSSATSSSATAPSPNLPAAKLAGARSPSTAQPVARQRLSSAVRGALPHIQYQLTRLGPAGMGAVSAWMAAVIIGALAIFSLHAGNETLKSRILQAQHHPKSPLAPEQSLTRFVAQLPTRSQIPAVLGTIMQQAQAAGVELGKGQYTYSPAANGGVGRYELAFPLKANYPEVRDFINRTLSNVPAAGLHKLVIERKVVGDTAVNADVRFMIFVRDR